jgi:maleate cis-trans isomerase
VTTLRIGLLLPSSNTTMEPDFYGMAPVGVTVHSARMMLKSVTVEGLEEMTGEALRAGALLASAKVDVLIYGCTSGSLIRCVDWEREFVSGIEAETGVPAVSTAGAVVEALRALGLRRVGVATPYTDDINGLERRFLEAQGFEVESILGLGLVDNHEIAAVPPEKIVELAEEAAAGSDGVFVSCTNLPAASLVHELEAKLRRPVVTSNQASMWAGLRVLGLRGFEGHGRLLEDLLRRSP